MSMSTVGSMSTEPSVIPGAVLDLTLRVDMKERTFLVRTGMESGIKVTFGHLTHVILMKELTHVTLLTETSEPVFADHCPVSFDVSEWT